MRRTKTLPKQSSQLHTRVDFMKYLVYLQDLRWCDSSKAMLKPLVQGSILSVTNLSHCFAVGGCALTRSRREGAFPSRAGLESAEVQNHLHCESKREKHSSGSRKFMETGRSSSLELQYVSPIRQLFSGAGKSESCAEQLRLSGTEAISPHTSAFTPQIFTKP